MSFRTHKKPILLHRGRKRKRRQRTFDSEEKARNYAELHKISDYTLVNLKNTESKSSKIRIVVNQTEKQ
ncbi:MAG: hypothetical protein V1740_01155 [Candidatus Woesearchaeota archaeon]